tara:strand:+ start:231 stop:416 length:186 start_codon:yes stop_codon:yes gene_type:complete
VLISQYRFASYSGNAEDTTKLKRAAENILNGSNKEMSFSASKYSYLLQAGLYGAQTKKLLK